MNRPLPAWRWGDVDTMAGMANATPESLAQRGTPYACALLAGLCVAAATFFAGAWSPLLAVLGVAAAMAIALRAERGHNLLGLAFFAGWIIPTTLWFYAFMTPVVLAAAASLGWVALMGNLFRILGLRRIPVWARLLIFSLVWAGWSWVRIRIPVTENWWLPHLGYAVWCNSGLSQSAIVAGEASVELLVLLLSAALAWAWCGRRRWRVVPTAVGVAAVIVAGHAAVHAIPDSTRLDRVLVVQSEEKAPALMERTAAALQRNQHVTTVVWPENHLDKAEVTAAQAFAKEHRIRLSVNATSARNQNVVKLIGADGRIVLVNTKAHIAPGENHRATFSENSYEHVTAYVCYDIHYPDMVERVGSARLVLGSVNDTEFPATEKSFHLADATFRAVQSHAAFALSSQDGPTALIDEHGRLVGKLPYENPGTLTSPAKTAH
jgi:apolipoprotein N-acyltransferase